MAATDLILFGLLLVSITTAVTLMGVMIGLVLMPDLLDDED